MPRPAKKKTRVLAEAEITGFLKGLTKHKSKTFKNKKQFTVWLQDRLEDFLAKIDPLEIVAVGGLTVLVKFGVEWTEDLPLQMFESQSLIRTLMRFLPIVGLAFDIIVPDIPPETIEQIKKALDSPPMELIQWLISFIIAFILVRHADRILETGKSMLGAAQGLMGLLIMI